MNNGHDFYKQLSIKEICLDAGTAITNDESLHSAALDQLNLALEKSISGCCFMNLWRKKRKKEKKKEHNYL